MASTESPRASVEQPSATHKRTYQACIPCRRRKVRCDLGSVDAPHDPPCVRCRREKKDCFFTETRRKRKAGDEEGGDLSEDYVNRNRRSQFDKREYLDDVLRDDPGGELPYGAYSENHSTEEAEGRNSRYERSDLFTPSGQLPALSAVGRKPGQPSENREVKNETAAALFQSPINNPGDALHLLVDAVAKTEEVERRNSKSATTLHNRKISGTNLPSSLSNSRPHIPLTALDPSIATLTGRERSAEDIGMKDAIRAWSRLRFVKAGWLTAREAIFYIDYYYRHLAPLTPISPPDFSSITTHPKLLNEEPMLAITLLTISTRYMKLQSPGGDARSFVIHDKCWDYLQGMITRMFWAQEQFGGGFCGAGASKSVEEIEARKRGLRSLGTVESLLLLSDWHPRSMHFPPGNDGDEILLAAIDSIDDQVDLDGSPKNPTAGWTEPALRSDRMCWSLVGFAYTLAYELGVFDSLIEHGTWTPDPQGRTSYDNDRARRVGRLLHIYMTQTCGRLGHPNMLPNQGNNAGIDYLKIDVNQNLFPGSYNPPTTSENIQRAWAELTFLMRQSNAEMFESKQMTHDRIQKGDYLRFLETYWPRLREWLQRFEGIEVPAHSRTMLMIEYEYTRTYINSLSLQAVLEQCATTADGSSSNAANATLDGGQTPPALLSSKMVDIYKENALYIAEVVDASRNLLRHVVDGLVPNDGLRHAPVRTYFRILSGAMFLLKTFAVGAKESEVSISISLLDATVKALRTNVVDDVHLCLRIADLLDGLTSSIRNKFVRLAIGRKKQQTSQPQARPSTSHRSPINNLVKPFAVQADMRQPTSHHDIDIYGASQPRTQGPLAGIITPLVDPNDGSIAIMPPPDYVYNAASFPMVAQSPIYNNNNNNNSNQQPLSPHAVYSPFSSMQPLTPHQQAQSQQPQQQYAFSPSLSSGSGGYDWLALDVNPLLNSSQNGVSANGNVGSIPWSGAFGPEISDSLEMLGVLADGYGFPDGMDGDAAGISW